MTIEELRSKKQELMARKKYELELQERGEGDNFALFIVNEELLDVNAQLRALAPAGKRPVFGRKGRMCSEEKGNRQQFINWVRQDSDEAAAEERVELKKMLCGELNSITGRQRQMLFLYAEGMRVVDIAQHLCVDRSTVSHTLKRAKSNVACIIETKIALNKLRNRNRLDMENPEVVKLMMGVLTTHQAVCFYLYYAEWLTIRQIGALLGVNHSTICRTIRRAVVRLNDILSDSIDILDHIEGMDDIVFAIYCGLDEQYDELPPVVKKHFRVGLPKTYTKQVKGVQECTEQVAVPKFQICGNNGTQRGRLKADQHGYLFQALQKRYAGMCKDYESAWTHPIVRWMMKVFQTLTNRKKEMR